MGPGDRLCRFDNAPKDGDSVEVAEVAHSHRHPAPNTGPRHRLPCLPLATQQWKKKTIQDGLLRRQLAASTIPKPRILSKGRVKSHYPHTLVSRKEMGAERLPSQSISPLFQHRPGEAILSKGVLCLWVNLACVHCHMPHQHGILHSLIPIFHIF